MAQIFATWTPPDYVFLKDFLVSLAQGLTPVEDVVIASGVNRYESTSVSAGLSYTVCVTTRSVLGTLSDPVCVTVLATADLIAYYEFATPTLVNMRAMYDWSTGQRYWVTAMASDTWNALFASTLNGYTNPLFQYHASGTSTLSDEEYDTGASNTGTWDGSMTTVAINGAPVNYIELRDLSTDPWTRHSGASFTGSARRVRLSSETTGTDTQRVNDLGTIALSA